MKKKLILFAGHLASGKTTLSKRISKDLKLTCLNKDDIKEILSNQIGFKNREENLKLSYATFDVMCYMVKRTFLHDDVMILESNFKPYELKRLQELSLDLKIDVYTLFLTGASKVLYDRYVIRDQTRDEAHRSTGLLSYEVFLKVMDEYVFDSSFHDDIIDTSHFDDDSYEKAKKKIEAFIKDERI